MKRIFLYIFLTLIIMRSTSYASDLKILKKAEKVRFEKNKREQQIKKEKINKKKIEKQKNLDQKKVEKKKNKKASRSSYVNIKTKRKEVDEIKRILSQENLTSKQKKVIKSAVDMLGIRYNLGGDDYNKRHGYDCSGFTQSIYRKAGKAIPRTANLQYNSSKIIPYENAKPGDLVFFEKTYKAGVPITHVGLYLGDGKMIHASSGYDRIKLDNVFNPSLRDKVVGFGRIRK